MLTLKPTQVLLPEFLAVEIVSEQEVALHVSESDEDSLSVNSRSG